MKKLVVSEFMSLDGVMEGPGGDDGYVHGPWTVPYWCDEIGAFKSEELYAADALLVGRRTYQGFASAWPDRSGDPFSDHINSIHHHVVSSTLTDDEATWAPTTVHRGDLAEVVGDLKAGPGEGDILVAGSATLVHGLLAADLVDELRLAVYPLTLGVGKRMFDDARLDLELAAQATSPTGVLMLTYRRATAAPTGKDHPFVDDITGPEA